MKNKIFETIIIGGGPSGIFATFSCGIYNIKSLLVDSASKIGGQCNNLYSEKYLYDIPGFKKIKAKDLVNNLIEQASIFDPLMLSGIYIHNIEYVDGIFYVHSKSEIFYAKTIILALGNGLIKPIKMHEKYNHLENDIIFYDINNINKFHDKTIAILGAGNTACDYILELSKIVKKIYLIHRGNNIKAYPYLWSNIQNIQNIDFFLPYQIENITQTEIEISSEKENIKLNIDYVIPCFGMQYQNAFISKLNLKLKNNKIIVDPCTMQTSQAGIYAIGDCIWHENKQNLILNSFSDAAKASKHIARFLYPDKAISTKHTSEDEKFYNI